MEEGERNREGVGGRGGVVCSGSIIEKSNNNKENIIKQQKKIVMEDVSRNTQTSKQRRARSR